MGTLLVARQQLVQKFRRKRGRRHVSLHQLVNSQKPSYTELLTPSGIMLIGALSSHHDPSGLQKNNNVVPERPIQNVPFIKHHTLFV